MHATLAEIQTAWANEFSGTSVLLVILRATLALADWQARQMQAQFHQLHLDLHNTGLPMLHWDPFTRQTFRFMERTNARAQREFRQALRAIQANYKKPEPAKKTPPPPDPPGKVSFSQTVYITGKDGIVKSSTETDAAFICAIPPDKLEMIGSFTRQIHFENSVVPDCYAAWLTHQGATFPPRADLSITYRKEDFLRLCRQEIETASPVLLDDEPSRLFYQWHD